MFNMGIYLQFLIKIVGYAAILYPLIINFVMFQEHL